MMVTVDDVGRIVEPIEIIDYGDSGGAKLLGYVAEFAAVGNGLVSALHQAERDVANIQLRAGAATQRVVSQKNAKAGQENFACA